MTDEREIEDLSRAARRIDLLKDIAFGGFLGTLPITLCILAGFVHWLLK